MNKPRLIDANELLDKIPYPWDADDALYYEKVIKAIADQPTAYDIDKVVEQLEKLSEEMLVVDITADKTNYGGFLKGRKIGVQKAIEIVKGGAE